ncbi:FtsB family cell division protein [Marinactinospora rubrisoli]|uniref:Septum formation initiator family protein n=1 Tax=Marinactinospora rubrisoli TaxID=2715399 RepID=A0ABW2K9P2_9ACTN
MPKVPEQPKGPRKPGRAGSPASGAPGRATGAAGRDGTPDRPAAPAQRVRAKPGSAKPGAQERRPPESEGQAAKAGRSAKTTGGGPTRGRASGKGTPPGAAGTTGQPAARPRPALTSRAAILGLVMCVIALSLAYPLREYIAQRSEIAQLQDQRARTEQSVAELRERNEELQDPAYIEREARTRLHYQYPGERAYVVLDGTDEEAAEPEATGPPDPWFTKLWKSILAADQAGAENEEIPEAQPPAR